MGEYARIGTLALVAVAYGVLVFAGGLFWYFGWTHHSERLSRAGDVAVLLGLWTDAVLVTSNWLFGWVGWLEVAMR